MKFFLSHFITQHVLSALKPTSSAKIASAINAQYESFGSDFNNVNDFKKFIIENTSAKHQFIFFDATSDGDTIEERYKVMKAPAIIPKFTVNFSK